MKKSNRTTAGFTLIELLVVIAIIGLLSSIVLASLNSARSKARDAKRKGDLRSIALALEMYYDTYGTYRIPDTGSSDNGIGWLSLETSGGGERPGYEKAVTRGLYEAGFLSAPIVMDPIQEDVGYMIYICKKGHVYAISATLENPTPEDIERTKASCNGSGGNGTHTRYGKNYVITNEGYNLTI